MKGKVSVQWRIFLCSTEREKKGKRKEATRGTIIGIPTNIKH